jgi:hypothetical protein
MYALDVRYIMANVSSTRLVTDPDFRKDLMLKKLMMPALTANLPR